MTDSLDFREHLREISSAMMKVHKVLMESEMETLELASGKIIPPTERLNILLNNPDFAWLRNLSRLIGDVDEIYFQKEVILERQLKDIMIRVHDLFSLENESEFTYRYRKSLGTVPDLMMEHGRLKTVLKKTSVQKS